MITIKDPVLEKKLIKYSRNRDMSVELYISNMISYEKVDIDFRELEESELTPEILSEIEKTKKADKSSFIDLSEKYG